MVVDLVRLLVMVDRVKAPSYNRLGRKWLESSNASFLRLGMNAFLGFLLLGIGWQVDLALRGN